MARLIVFSEIGDESRDLTGSLVAEIVSMIELSLTYVLSIQGNIKLGLGFTERGSGYTQEMCKSPITRAVKTLCNITDPANGRSSDLISQAEVFREGTAIG